MSDQEMFEAEEDKSSDEEDPIEDSDSVAQEEIQNLFKKQYKEVCRESVSWENS